MHDLLTKWLLILIYYIDARGQCLRIHWCIFLWGHRKYDFIWQKLRLGEIIAANIRMKSDQIGIKSDTNLTDGCCALVAGDRSCVGLARLARTTCYSDGAHYNTVIWFWEEWNKCKKKHCHNVNYSTWYCHTSVYSDVPSPLKVREKEQAC